MLRKTDYLIGGAIDPFISRLLLRAPPCGLVAAGDHNDKPNVLAFLALGNYGLCREGVESQSAPNIECCYTHVVAEIKDARLETLPQFIRPLGRHNSMTRKTTGSLFYFHIAHPYFRLICSPRHSIPYCTYMAISKNDASPYNEGTIFGGWQGG